MSNTGSRQTSNEQRRGEELFCEQFREGEAERLGDAGDVHERDVSESAFDAADVGPMDTGFLGQHFL